MKTIPGIIFLALLVVGPIEAMGSHGDEPVSDLSLKLQRIFQYRNDVADIHPLLAALYPVAVLDGDRLLVFDLAGRGEKYCLAREVPNDLGIGKGIRASFPLKGYDNRTVCVVSPEVFDEPGGYAIIFHEFVHCSQWLGCEQRLKERLSIYKKAMEAKDYMWELNYPFPYGDGNFVKIYLRLLQELDKGDSAAVSETRRLLRETLSAKDFEYLTWQEWKEGMARYIENLVRRRLHVPENHFGVGWPLDRVSFYEVGSRLIAFFEQSEPGLTRDLEKLYERIRGTEPVAAD